MLKKALFAITILLTLAGSVPSLEAAPARSTMQQRRAHAAAVRARAARQRAAQRRRAAKKHHKRHVTRAARR